MKVAQLVPAIIQHYKEVHRAEHYNGKQLCQKLVAFAMPEFCTILPRWNLKSRQILNHCREKKAAFPLQPWRQRQLPREGVGYQKWIGAWKVRQPFFEVACRQARHPWRAVREERRIGGVNHGALPPSSQDFRKGGGLCNNRCWKMSDWQSLLQTLLSADRSPSHGRDSWTGLSELIWKI